ncbi:unnamed protein product [Medioppia subpectinata]|uniref:Niemann-Pick C1 N-terminal domain-containing protein n=1 Tax=Medioppia subpectinata TaxID=1979941 RepID=A0A7R9Q4P0_9ACAR|nr:unnamed protein product [Medioppia subpectinata]CAG2112858.1 unnamed protein product [Medioppia subpectinata]
MDSICKIDGVKKNSPCHQMHAPYDNVTDDDFYELLSTNCPHYFNHKGELLHRLCCSPEQEESVTRLLNYADLISRSCPACAVNAKKYFCNLFCLPNQNQMIKIEKTSGDKNQS